MSGPSVRSHRVRVQSHKTVSPTRTHPLQVPVVSLGYHPCLKVSRSLSLGAVNLQRQLEPREILTFICVLKDTDEQLDEETEGARSGRVPRTGASVLVELGCIPLLG